MAELHFNLFMRVTREGTDSSPISRVEENSRFQELGRKTLSQSANVYREREREKERERISKRREVSDGTDDDRRDDHSNGKRLCGEDRDILQFTRGSGDAR